MKKRLFRGGLPEDIEYIHAFFYKKIIILPEPQFSYHFPKLILRFSQLFLTVYWNKLAWVVYTFVSNIAYMNLNSIFNILNAITTKYLFLAYKNT